MTAEVNDYLEVRLAELIQSGRAVDLGADHWYSFTVWAPDRELNPQYDAIPDINPAGAQVWHRRADGTLCSGHVTFDSEHARVISPGRPVWQVESLDPLTISPSVLCTFPIDGVTCGDHGWITDGKWIPA